MQSFTVDSVYHDMYNYLLKFAALMQSLRDYMQIVQDEAVLLTYINVMSYLEAELRNNYLSGDVDNFIGKKRLFELTLPQSLSEAIADSNRKDYVQSIVRQFFNN